MKKFIFICIAVLALAGCGTKEPDISSVASITADAPTVQQSLSAQGNWITAITADVTFEEDLVVDGTFHRSDDSANEVYRKLALHTQDSSYNVIDNFTLTTPTLVVRSENFTVFYGTIVGNVHVYADGFTLHGTTVKGNVIFETEAYKDSSDLTVEGANVTGDITVAE